MTEEILRALEHSRADYADVRVEKEWRTQVTYRGKELENLEMSSEVGGIVRSLVDGGWGIVVFNSLDELEQRVDDAYRIG
jgi:TldD protein